MLFLGACSKPETNPELKDPIYQDIVTQMGLTEKSISEMEKKLETHHGELKKVVPQTGQIKYVEKRIWETQKTLDQLKQQQKYWIIRKDQRRDLVRQKSIEAFNKGEKWSDPAEYEAYLTEKRLRLAKIDWDTKERRANFMKESGLQTKGDQKPSSAPASGH
ncbi:MAG TPA: hypothetical protein PL182_01940 [Pseudobdellovibrionaceae bacterium]|nr:hypothetical protein [Pseudobdellovibrionaceae bacterium]